jgi:hypothetical protein
MKEVNLHYFVPESHEELKGLVGKCVGVKLLGDCSPEPMVYVGGVIYEDWGDEYGFIRQGLQRIQDKYYPQKKVLEFSDFIENIRFSEDGIILSSDKYINSFSESSKEYGEYVQLLKNNNQWNEPAIL